MTEQRRGCRTAIAREASHARAGYGLDEPIRRDLPHAVVVSVGHVSCSEPIHGDAFGLAEQRGQCRSAIANQVAARGRVDGIRFHRQVSGGKKRGAYKR
jgi:hypothetical protein